MKLKDKHGIDIIDGKTIIGNKGTDNEVFETITVIGEHNFWSDGTLIDSNWIDNISKYWELI